MSGRQRFTGEIAGAGSTSGTRLVVGNWWQSPLGAFTDVMIQQADDWRVLVAPTPAVADLVASTYVFDEIVVGPVGWRRTGAAVAVGGPGLDLVLTVGPRTRLGQVLGLVPERVATAPGWARAVAPLSAVLVPGVRTFGSAGGGRWEAYGATDVHRLIGLSGTWRGHRLGALAAVEPPVRVGFASTPRTPSLTTLVTTIGAQRGVSS